MEKKKILFVVHHLTIGGVQKSLVSALHIMNYDKYDIDLYLQKDRTVLLPYIDKRVNVIINKDTRHYYRHPYCIILVLLMKFFHFLNFKTISKIYKDKLADYLNRHIMTNAQKTYFKDKKYDVAISYDAGYEALFTSKYINADKKIVCFQSSTIEYPEMQRDILPAFDRVIVEDQAIESLLKEEIPQLKSKINVIQNYVDTDFIHEQANETESIVKDDRIVICSVGRQTYIKGFDLAAKAAKRLKDRNVNFIWYIVGDGPEREKISSIINENSLNDNVILTGMKQNPYPYVKACDIFVQPSREEAMSIAALESQILCKPLVTTKTVGGMNICKNGETGVITDISADAIADGIMSLINNPELISEISENLRQTDYSIEKERYRKQWDSILEEV